MMDQKPNFDARSLPSGFALVVSLSLLSLLSVIAIGLLSLSSVTSRSAGNNKQQTQADQNARLALSMAIGQLQRHLGDDRRVSVAADILTNPTDLSQSSALPEFRNWTGVYESWPHTEEERPEPNHLAWLVSGDGNMFDEDSPVAGVPGNLVEVVGRRSPSSSPDDSIMVPLVKINETGAVAWWTGDQGLKAAVDIVRSEPSSTEVLEAAQRLQTAPASGVELVSTDVSRPLEVLDQTSQKLETLTSLEQIELFTEDQEETPKLFHDLATQSRGLLVNVREGGFRKDLTMELEVSEARRPTAPLYEAGGQAGINFEELWTYYNIHKELVVGTKAYTTGDSIPALTPSLEMKSSPGAAATDVFHHYKMPTIISYQTVFSLAARVVGEGDSQRTRFDLIVDPIVTLWNPHDVPLVVPRSSYLSVKYWQIPYSIILDINNRIIEAPLASSLAADNGETWDANYATLQVGRRRGITLKPGEIVKFSQGGAGAESSTRRQRLIAAPGFNFGGGIQLPLRDRDGNDIILDGARGRLRYSLVANELTCGQHNGSGVSLSGRDQHNRHYSMNHHEVFVGDTNNSGPSLGIGGLYVDWDFGNQPVLVGEERESDTPGTKSPEERLSAVDFPQVFRAISGPTQTRVFSIDQLVAEKAPIMLYSYNVKTEQTSDLGTATLSRFNPKAHHVDFYDLSEEEKDWLPYEISIEPLTSRTSRFIESSADGNGFFGAGYDASAGSTRVTTHGIPRAPLLSLAALQHSSANGFQTQKPIGGYATLGGREPVLPQISHAIGNSCAIPSIPSDQTERDVSGGRAFVDHSYLANQKLWDDWFFSGLAPQSGPLFVEEKGHLDVVRDFFTERVGANSRYLPNTDGRDLQDIVESLISGSTPTEDAARIVASLLEVEGMFNVNSTSVEAWVAVLSSLNNSPTVTASEQGQPQFQAGEEGVPIIGLFTPLDQTLETSESPDPRESSQWNGRRILNDVDVRALAEAIVGQVRLRGPFLSLADFVNRRVGEDVELARSGAIQSALDSPETGLNRAFSNREVEATVAQRFAFPEAEEGPVSKGIPGIIKQADILTPIAPILSVRSDTFIVRGYGESRSEDGRVLAKSWCEAVVQRDADYVESTEDSREVLPEELQSQVNERFGRRFKIVSFRWLNSDEI